MKKVKIRVSLMKNVWISRESEELWKIRVKKVKNSRESEGKCGKFEKNRQIHARG